MKFILNENEKYILEEKVFLAEEDDNASQVIDNFTDKLDDLNAASKEIKDKVALRTMLSKKINGKSILIFTKLQDIEDALNNNQAWNNRQELFTEIEKYITMKKESLNTVDDIIADSSATIKNIDPQVINDFKTYIKQVIKQLDELSDIITTLKSTSQSAENDNKLNNLREKYKNLKDFIDKQGFEKEITALLTSQEIKKLINDLDIAINAVIKNGTICLELCDKNETLLAGEAGESIRQEIQEQVSIIDKCRDEYTQLDLANPKDTTEFKAALSTLLKTCMETNEGLKKLIEQIKNLEADAAGIADDDSEIEATTNWKSLFLNAAEHDIKNPQAKSQVDEVWDKYFNTEWPKNIYNRTTVEKLIPALNKEFKTYGYTGKTNPFVYFLQERLKDKTFSDILNANPSGYNVLHNAVADDIVDEDDLYGGAVDGATLGKDNIIFSSDLFTKSATDMKDYLDQQYIVATLYEKSGHPFKDHSKLSTTGEDSQNLLNTKYGDKLADFIPDLFYKDGNVLTNTLKRTVGHAASGLKSLQEIRRTMKICFDAEEIETAVATLEANRAKANTIKISPTNLDSMVEQLEKAVQKANGATDIYKKVLCALCEQSLGLTNKDQVYKALGIDQTITKSMLTKSDYIKVLNQYLPHYDITKLIGTDPELLNELIEKIKAKMKLSKNN